MLVERVQELKNYMDRLGNCFSDNMVNFRSGRSGIFINEIDYDLVTNLSEDLIDKYVHYYLAEGTPKPKLSIGRT